MEASGNTTPIQIEPVRSERPLTIAVAVVAVLVWVLLGITAIGLLYAVIIGLFFFIAHVIFITHVRGNGIRISPQQMPDLYQRVSELSRRIGLKEVPEGYVIQAGGILNALATKFLRSHIIILFSDLIEACGENESARDMIIAHELGHLKQGHLKREWFLLPGLLFPFLGQALSRAREYTCDRYGLAGAGNREGALRGLAILAAGAVRGPQVNFEMMARQVTALNTAWMTIGQWLSTHPPLAKRIIALDESLRPAENYVSRGTARALGVITVSILLPTALVVGGANVWQSVVKNSPFMQIEGGGAISESSTAEAAPLDALEQKASDELFKLKDFVLDLETVPADMAAFASAWSKQHGGQAGPQDPFGQPYIYWTWDDGFVVLSKGHNGVLDEEDEGADDLYVEHTFK